MPALPIIKGSHLSPKQNNEKLYPRTQRPDIVRHNGNLLTMSDPLEIPVDSLSPAEQRKYVEKIMDEVGEEQKLESLERERGQGMSWSERHEH